jgi:ribonuclease-3
MVDRRADQLAELEEILGYRFSDRELLERALRHGSSDLAPIEGSYQRLEFLGDAVLGHAIARMLFESFRDADEGVLTKMRAHLVRSTSLASKAAWLGLEGWVRMSSSEERQHGRERPALLEDVFEAIIGALVIDGGWEAASAFIEDQFRDELEAMDQRTLILADAKSALNQAAQARGFNMPEYLDTGGNGPDHRPMWVSRVSWNGEEIARGEGPTKRDAQQQAARRALARLGLLPEVGT